MPHHSSKRVVYTAIAANLAIAVAKSVAAALTRSPSMLAEAVHSGVDTGNEFLLLLGMKRSARPPDKLHPFGHGKALYFYALLVAVYIFGFGGALAVYRGILQLIHPGDVKDVEWNYLVLALAFLFEGYSWRISYKALLERKDANESVWDEVIGSKDPAVFTVFLEDTAALAGIVLAFLGILLGQIFHNPYFDPAASILIGVLLSAVALLLGRESGALLIGERTNRSRIRKIQEAIEADSGVEKVGDLLTMQLGPEQVLVAANVRFRRGMDIGELEKAIDRLETGIRNHDKTVARIFLEADSLRSRKSA